MPDDVNFLEDILEWPEDDTVRLIYADWLEEHSNPRGEHIRIQCQIADWLKGGVKADDRALFAREAKLWPDALFQILDTVKPIIPQEATVYRWNEMPPYQHKKPELYVGRGFINEAWVALQQWLDCGPDLMACQPIQIVRAIDKQPADLYHSYAWLYGEADNPSYIHGEIFRLLGKLVSHEFGFALYKTAAEAIDDLSSALIRWAKALSILKKYHWHFIPINDSKEWLLTYPEPMPLTMPPFYGTNKYEVVLEAYQWLRNHQRQERITNDRKGAG